jgi:carbamoyl-phosphate synthase large subunit
VQIAWLLSKSGTKVTENDVRKQTAGLGMKPSFKLVDTCAAEFPAETPYYYSAYESLKMRAK